MQEKRLKAEKRVTGYCGTLQMKQFFNAAICGVLRDFVPCAQFKKREKHPWRSVAFSKVVG